MKNSLGFSVHYKNGTEYNISSTTDENEFEIWLDNRVDGKDLNFTRGLTSFPPTVMGSFEMTVPKLSALFLNVMHDVKTSKESYNITNSSGHIIGVGYKQEILNAIYYHGLEIADFSLFNFVCIGSKFSRGGGTPERSPVPKSEKLW